MKRALAGGVATALGWVGLAARRAYELWARALGLDAENPLAGLADRLEDDGDDVAPPGWRADGPCDIVEDAELALGEADPRDTRQDLPLPDPIADVPAVRRTVELLLVAISLVLAPFGLARERFREFRHGRPFWGGSILVFGGFVVGYIPFHLAINFALIPGSIAFVGAIFAVLIILSGVFAVAKPEFSSFFGAFGIVVAVLSIVGGALGGLFVGTVISVAGGALCYGWIPPEKRDEYDEKPLTASLRDLVGGIASAVPFGKGPVP